MRRDISTTEQMQIDPNMSLFDYFGQEYSFETMKGNSIFQLFQNKIRVLNNLCKNLLLDIGMAQVMYGRFWFKLQYCEFEMVEEWIRNNHRRRYQIFNPENHNIMMNTDSRGNKDYRLWFERGIE